MTTMLIHLINLVISILGSLLLFRAYLWYQAISPRDPMCGFVWKVTDWIVNPVGCAVRPRGGWDWPSIASAVLLAVVHVLVVKQITGLPATPLAFLLAPLALAARWAIDIILWAVIVYCIISFTSAPRSPYRALVGTLVDPFLRPFRRFLPLVAGRFDLSPVLLFLLLNVLMTVLAPISAGAIAL
ncbi:MAG: YggT family protein [Duodenibacillus sp.]|nr:YggT family protein [Duodenibacillus sp.]